MSLELKKIRMKRGIKIEDVAHALNIKLRYLKALENEDFDQLPDSVYINGYTKLYSDYLGVKFEKPAFLPKNKQASMKSSVIHINFQKYYLPVSIICLILTFICYNYIKNAVSVPAKSTMEYSYITN